MGKMKNTVKSNGVKQKSKKKVELEVEQEHSEDDGTHDEAADDGDVSDNSMEYESGGNDSPSETEDNEESTQASNPGWADAMQKILNTKKPKRKKSIVLSKAKRLSEVQKKEKKEDASEVDAENKGPAKEDDQKIKKLGTDEIQVKQRRKDPVSDIRMKPSIHDREREKMLQKIATKGVVQLFNAVKQQQVEIDKKLSQAGPLERKREQVLKNIDKRAFLDVLMGGSKSVPVNSTKESEKNEPEKKDEKIWSVLRDDFVMGGRMKNWDKKGNEEDEDSSAPEEMDSDD